MRLPFDYLPASLASRLPGNPGLLLLGMLTLLLGEPMRAHADALIGPAAPLGILSLQFACSADSANAILAAWDDPARLHARQSLFWDMGFAAAYGSTLTALTQRVIAYRARRGRTSWTVVAWLPLWAALADWLENLLHLSLIVARGGGEIALVAPLACSAALLKWGLLLSWLLGVGWIALFKPAAVSN